jgi:hypothetical protein
MLGEKSIDFLNRERCHLDLDSDVRLLARVLVRALCS